MTSATTKHSRPVSRIMSGSELSPLKILQGRVTGPSAGSPASPDGMGEGHHHRESSGHVSAAVSVSGSASASGSVTSSPPTTATQRSMSVSSSGPMLPPPIGRTPRKVMSPERRFPVKVSVPPHHVAVAPAAPTPDAAVSTPVSPRRQPTILPESPDRSLFSQLGQQHYDRTSHGRRMSLDEAIEHNESLKHAIEIFEDETNAIENSINGVDDALTTTHTPGSTSSRRHTRGEEDGGIDDTMLSTFSTFSAVPNMAMLSKLGGTGQTEADGSLTTPMRTPRTQSTGPAPNRAAAYEHGNTTNLLMDFTEQLRVAHSQQQAALGLDGSGGVAATPRKSTTNILDFEIPPLPTPRSIPTVTPRELESLKSNFLSEISSLKATLSGKEAEVLALKTAVGDAEKRVGECMENMREDQVSRQQVIEEKDLWERRGREMEEMLRKMKAELLLGQQEREELEGKFEELDKRREMAEMMAQEAETKMAVMRAGGRSAAGGGGGGGGGAAASGGSSSTQREVEMAVERVARELHAAYKAKHETKVAALKKSYEARWEKRVRELEATADTLARENETLRAGREATLTRMLAASEEDEERRRREARDATQIKELGAEVHKLEAVVRTVKADNAELRTLLEQERVEKGELVILAEEMMSMQQSFVANGTSGANANANGANGANGSSVANANTNTNGHGPGTPSRLATGTRSPSIPEGRSGSATGHYGITSPSADRFDRSRQPKTPSTMRTMHAPTTVSHMPPPSTSKRNSMVYGSAAVTPKPARPISMHGTGRISGLKPPSSSMMASGGAAGGSRISRIGHIQSQSQGHERKQGSVGGIPRPGSGLAMRSGGLMSSIEKMGNYRGQRE